MWQLNESYFVKSHIASSIATLFCSVSIVFICLFPSLFPGIYRLLVDDRISIVVPYMLFLALGGSIFSIWYFLFRKWNE